MKNLWIQRHHQKRAKQIAEALVNGIRDWVRSAQRCLAGLTVNEARALYGLGPTEEAWGNERIEAPHMPDEGDTHG